MTPAEQSLKQARLQEALTRLQDEIRGKPGSPTQRIFLFQLLALQGQWARAATQLEVLRDMDAQSASLVQTYSALLRCELLRTEVWAGGKTPLLFGEPFEWTVWLIEALKLDAANQPEQAKALRDRAFELAPASPGTLEHGKPGAAGASEADAPLTKVPFAWAADADSRLGPVLEAVINGKYYWVPFARLRSLQIEAPADLRDFVWLPAVFELETGATVVGFIPSRYPGSESSADDLVRLARKTEWIEKGPDTFHGLGQRMVATDAGEFALLDVRGLRFDA